MDDLIAFLTARLDEREAKARDLLRTAQHAKMAVREPRLLGREIPGWHSWADVEAICESALREVAATRAILARVVPAVLDLDWKLIEETALDRDPEVHMLLLKLLALPYNTHPDYRPERAPGGPRARL